MMGPTNITFFFFYTSNNIWYAFYYIEENIQFFFKIFLEKTLDD